MQLQLEKSLLKDKNKLPVVHNDVEGECSIISVEAKLYSQNLFICNIILCIMTGGILALL